MTISFTFFAPTGVPPVISCRSGNSYSADANGFVKLVSPADVLDMEQAGCVCLGQLTGKDNWTATTNPGVSNDSSQDYTVGSKWFNKNTGVLYVAGSVGVGVASWSPQGTGVAGIPWVTGRFYGVPAGVTPVAFLTVASVLYAYPVFVPNAVTLAAIGVGLTTGQTGGLVEAGLYADDGAGYPGALVAGTDTGDLTASGGAAVLGPTNLAVALTPGWYWAAVQAKATSTMPSVAGSTVAYTNVLGSLIGSDTAAHELAAGSEAVMAISKTSLTYAALLTTFPAGAAPILASGAPLVSLGV